MPTAHFARFTSVPDASGRFKPIQNKIISSYSGSDIFQARARRRKGLSWAAAQLSDVRTEDTRMPPRSLSVTREKPD